MKNTFLHSTFDKSQKIEHNHYAKNIASMIWTHTTSVPI